jgi:hypothetical protein
MTPKQIEIVEVCMLGVLKQKEVAACAGCTPQYINKVLKAYMPEIMPKYKQGEGNGHRPTVPRKTRVPKAKTNP